MVQAFEWDRGLLSTDTVEFDRALHRLRRAAAGARANPAAMADLVTQLNQEPGITRRELDRRFPLIVATIVGNDITALREIAENLRRTSPEALNAIRTLLPAELRHVAALSPLTQPSPPPAFAKPIAVSPPGPTTDRGLSQGSSKYSAVALLGTPDEHVHNVPLLRSAGMKPLPAPSLDHFWNLAPTGLCGFVIGGSVWHQVQETDQRRTIRRLCEYSTFLFVRVCVDGLSPGIAQTFSQAAAEARCGSLDGRKFCHGRDCDLTPADITELEFVARFLEDAGTADFFPLGLSESEASLLRLIAADRRDSGNPLTIKRLGTRELPSGRSGARVFLLHDGITQPFVVKLHDRELLTNEVQRYKQWIQNWEPTVTNPVFHSHLGRAAISYRLQPAPDHYSDPAPTLEDRLEQLRAAEWLEPIERSSEMANDLLQALARAVNSLANLNSRPSNGSAGDDFWLNWPIRDLAFRGIDYTLLDQNWRPMELARLVQTAMTCLKPNLNRGVVHGDIHGRNILLVDRIPAFIDFALSGPGHPLVDLVRLDALVRSVSMRMILDKQSMGAIFRAAYIDGMDGEHILVDHPAVAASPSAALAIRTAAAVRKTALEVAATHGIGLTDYLAMNCIVSAHVLVNRIPGSGIERLLLSVVGPSLLAGAGE